MIGIRSIYTLVAKIVGQNENLGTAVSNYIQAVAGALKPVLDFIAAVINTFATILAKLFKVNLSTSKSAAKISKTLLGFDEINQLGGNVSTGNGNGNKDPGIIKWLEDLLIGLWEMIKGFVQMIAGIIGTLILQFTIAGQAAVAIVSGIVGILTGTLWGTIKGIFSAIGPLISGLWKTVKDLFADIGGVIWNTIKAFAKGFADTLESGKGIIAAVFTALWEAVKAFFSSFWNLAKNLFTNIFSTLKSTLTAFWQGFKSGFTSVVTWFQKNIISPIIKLMSAMYESAIKPLFKTISSGWESVKSGFTKFINGVKGMFNAVIKVINKIPGVNIPLLASGGFVSSGQMFIARENGPELVGTMGNKNVVANNNQIVEGIKKGVMEAMANSGNNNGVTNVYVDGDRLFSFVTKKNNQIVYQTGQSPLLV